MDHRIKVAIAGVGNCACSLVQGVAYYRDADPAESVPGLMHVELGGYHVRDIELVAAFDVHAGKVGRELSEAVLAPPNNTIVFAKPDPSGVVVERGPTLYGIGQYMADEIVESEAPPVDFSESLRRS